VSDAVKITGGCLCGAVRYEASQAPIRSAACHCRMCQLAVGAPFVTMVHFPSDAFAYTRGVPASYKSSTIAERGFCAECGTSLFYRVIPELYDSICVFSATLDKPNEFPPETHSGVESQLHWLKLADGLPRTEYLDDFIDKWKSGEDVEKLYRSV
jgi:adenylate cyclase